MIGQPVELSLATFLEALARAGGEEPHRIFAGGPGYTPGPPRGRLSESSVAELAELGLVHTGELTDAFLDTLHVLAGPQVECFAHVRDGEHQYGALIASGPIDAATALSENERVLIKRARRDELAATLTAHLPSCPPARMRPFSAPRETIADDGADDMDYFGNGPNRSRAAEELQWLLTPPFAGFGYLHVARRDPRGRRVQAEQAITYTDSELGRIGFDITGPPENQHVTAFPGDTGSLTERLNSLYRELD